MFANEEDCQIIELVNKQKNKNKMNTLCFVLDCKEERRISKELKSKQKIALIR